MKRDNNSKNVTVLAPMLQLIIDLRMGQGMANEINGKRKDNNMDDSKLIDTLNKSKEKLSNIAKYMSKGRLKYCIEFCSANQEHDLAAILSSALEKNK